MTWNRDEYNAFRGAVRTGDVVLEAGANVGAYTMLFAQWAGASGRVFAFEPDPIAYAGLQKHIVLNGMIDRVTPVAAAVADGKCRESAIRDRRFVRRQPPRATGRGRCGESNQNARRQGRVDRSVLRRTSADAPGDQNRRRGCRARSLARRAVDDRRRRAWPAAVRRDAPALVATPRHVGRRRARRVRGAGTRCRSRWTAVARTSGRPKASACGCARDAHEDCRRARVGRDRRRSRDLPRVGDPGAAGARSSDRALVPPAERWPRALFARERTSRSALKSEASTRPLPISASGGPTSASPTTWARSRSTAGCSRTGPS